MLPGADVRVTIRNSQAVRLEVVQRPSEDQMKEGILNPWYRDATDRNQMSSDYWLWAAVDKTDFSGVPDGEWAGEAVGEKIRNNILNLEGQKVYLSSLFPWRDTLDCDVIPPKIGRTPMDFQSLQYWITTTNSAINPDSPLEGIIWWIADTPVASIRQRYFPSVKRNLDIEEMIPNAYGDEKGD